MFNSGSGQSGADLLYTVCKDPEQTYFTLLTSFTAAQP